MSIGIQFDLRDNPSKIERMILEAIRDKMRAAFRIASASIEKYIKQHVIDSIRNCPEWESLKRGKLRADFGLPDSLDIDSLLDTWGSQFEVKLSDPKISANQIVGGINIGIVDESHKDVLTSSIAEIQSKNGKVFWLEWLLFAGDNIVVNNYHVIYGLTPVQQANSRTGEALMSKGNDFKVDSIYSGTIDNNFITRALDNLGPIINNLAQQEVIKHI